ncbi:MAG: 2-polyprenyl-3-methyl-5-hydroxy-6-metoxy-1,4-benzoquinol methylase [Gammaproteobacteria bacterium]|jgi:2-polyprenyl-3-methyl-5-hydroxy-6-metoxy-1,4-benzoquinol methylase
MKKTLSPNDMQAAIEELGVEPEACMLCGAPKPEPFFEKSGKTFFRCSSCEFVFIHAIYPEFVEDTDHLSSTYEFETVLKPNSRQRQKMDVWLKHLSPKRTQGELLEIGCGQGIFLQYAQEAGWKVQGVDVLGPVVEVAREQRGLNVFHGELAEANFETNSFDACFLSEVIEHIVDPIELMSEIHRVLRPGGVAVLGTGNACSWSAKFRGPKWRYYRFGGHLHIRYFGPNNAKYLSEKAGFQSIEVHTHGFAFGESCELKGQWYKGLAKVVQGLLSPFATLAGRGHRLLLVFHKEV